jgi:hypothetical protein
MKRTLIMLVLLALATAPTPAGAQDAAPETGSPSPAAPDLTAFDGLGVWIDIYDPWAFDDPVATVVRARRHGVQTLFVETSNYSRDFAIYRPVDMARLIRAAHVRNMDVIAWYLPGLYRPAFDFKRSMAAIAFHRNGQRFDGFGLDIEHAGVRPESLRNDRLVALSRRIDANAPASFPLSAIIPSPRGMELAGGYWPHFPYPDLAPFYDVWQPMTYYTYRVKGRQDVYDYTRLNTQILRDETGDPNLPIHHIGGIASQSSGLETAGFVDAILDDGLTGGSIYDMGLSDAKDWTQLERLVP